MLQTVQLKKVQVACPLPGLKVPLSHTVQAGTECPIPSVSKVTSCLDDEGELDCHFPVHVVSQSAPSDVPVILSAVSSPGALVMASKEESNACALTS